MTTRRRARSRPQALRVRLRRTSESAGSASHGGDPELPEPSGERLPARLRRGLRGAAGWLVRRGRSLLGRGVAAREALIALALNSTTSLAAGAFLGSIEETFEALPGLLVLVPAAIGLRGNVFSALGNRLSTAIRTGTFEFSLRRDSLLRQNVEASLVLTLSMSVLMAAVAKLTAVALGRGETVPLADLVMISVLGGILASLVVALATVALAEASVRYGWDLDNVTAPLVSTLGDVLTIPALWLVTQLDLGARDAGSAAVRAGPAVAGAVLGLASLGALAWGWRARRPALRGVVRESAPILFVALCLSTLAGLALDNRETTLNALPAFLILVPAFISSAGALGGILSSRLSSKLHLGLVAPRPLPGREVARDGLMVVVLSAPVIGFNAVGAHLVALALGQTSPGLPAMVAASFLGGVVATAFVIVIAYYGTVASVVLGVDPDTYGIPVVTSSVDFIGAVALLGAIGVLGLV